MPRTRARYPVRRRRPTRRPTRRPSVAYRALALARRASRKELKHIDSSYGLTNITSTPANAMMKFLSPVAQGTTSEERIGRAFKAAAIHLKFQVQFTAGGNASQSVRWMLYLHHDTDGAPPSTSEMFESDTEFNPFANKNNPKYGRILKSGYASLDAYHLTRSITFYKRLNYIGTCDGATDAIADTTRNSLYLIAWGDQAAANYPVMNHADFRFSFTDA